MMKTDMIQDEQRRYIIAALKPFKDDLPEPFEEGTKTYDLQIIKNSGII